MRFTKELGAIALCALVSTGCGAAVATPTTPDPPTSASPTAAAAPAAAEGPEEITGASTEQVSVDGTSFGALTAVRTARHDTFDRVVFEFRDGNPGYLVGYVDEVRAEGSGDPVTVGGGAALLVVLRPAGGTDPNGTATYGGSTRLPGQGTDQLVEVVRTGDFEAHLAWAVGVRQERPFVVRKLADPPRIVVDIAH